MKFFPWILCLALLTSNTVAQETELYVVDVGPDRGQPWQVLKYDENGQNPEIFINTELSRPQDIVFLENQGIALVSNLFSGRITKYDASSGAFVGDFATGIGQPTRIKIGADNLLYVLQWSGNGRVWRYQLDGSFLDEFTSVGVSNSIGMDWDSEGNLYVASFDARHVRKFDANGNDNGLFISNNLQGPTNIWFASNGDLIVLDWSGQAIKRFDSNGAFQSNFALGLSEPEGVEFLSNGDILIGNGGTSSVRQYDANGNFVKDFIPSGLGGLAKPNALRFRQVPNFQMNAGLNDAWFNPAIDGQGFYLAVFPDRGLVTLAWFTYDTELPGAGVTANLGDPGHRWLTALGTIEGNQAVLNISVTSGGLFDTASDISRTEDGSITLTFDSCNSGTAAYDIPSIDQQGVVPIQRVVTDNIALCEALIAR